MPVGCKIIKDFQRPAPEVVAMFKDMPVANIDDSVKVSTGPAQRKNGAQKRPCKQPFFARLKSIFNQV